MPEDDKPKVDGSSLKDTSVSTEVALSATDIDLIEVAKITGGTVSFNQNRQPKVTWGAERNSPEMEWTDARIGKETIGGRKTLRFWRGEFGGLGNEIYGAVKGKDFFALVQPKRSCLYQIEEGSLVAEIIKGGKVREVFGPEAMFSQVFIQARDIADRNLEAHLEHNPGMAEFFN